jgi:hypothetical protein
LVEGSRGMRNEEKNFCKVNYGRLVYTENKKNEFNDKKELGALAKAREAIMEVYFQECF